MPIYETITKGVTAPAVRSAVLLGIPGASSPALANFTGFNTKISPRTVDVLLFFQALPAEPIWYSSYPTWADSLAATIMTSWQPSGTMTSITNGSQDTYLHAQAATAKAYGKPVMVRLAHEMNGNWNNYGNTKETGAAYVTAWQYIVNLFQADGATNVQWVWCPNIWGLAGTPQVDPTPFFPGDDYVDFVGLDGYMMTANTDISQPADLFLANYRTLMALSAKPFYICEVGVAAQSRLTASGGKADWYQRLGQMIRNDMPRCVGVNTWERNNGTDDTTVDSSGGDSTAKAAFISAVTAAPFVGAPGVSPRRGFIDGGTA